MSFVAQPLGKAYAARGQAHTQIDVLDFTAHDFIAHTSTDSIDMAFPLRPCYQFSKELLYFRIYFVLHFFLFMRSVPLAFMGQTMI